ncbi:hypothetical protein [Mucilaginibacter antarcticus]|uniref:Lipocalin-like protein n=1 Tax=Mucilaginibacter antarcticus TaxID=1855725 RepID=A0ABW5XK30_9SPHI
MMKKDSLVWCFLLAAVLLASCRKEVRTTDICLHDSSIDYMKRWSIKNYQTDVVDASGKLLSHSMVYPNGYFQINSNYSYNLFSDDAPFNGTWSINKNCEFVLNSGGFRERRFTVVKLSDDSLILHQKIGQTTVIQRYAAFKCPTSGSLIARWDMAFTLQRPYGIDTVYKSEFVKQSGYFRLNPDASYNVVFNSLTPGTPPAPPVNGTWGVAQPGCLLVLDKNKTNERSFEVQKVNADSLVIWRKDTVNNLNLSRHYSKHK